MNLFNGSFAHITQIIWSDYQQRYEKYKNWKNLDKPLAADFRAGLTVDVRDENYVWCKGKYRLM